MLSPDASPEQQVRSLAGDDPVLGALLTSGVRQGFITSTEAHQRLPDKDDSPEGCLRVRNLVSSMERLGIEFRHTPIVVPEYGNGKVSISASKDPLGAYLQEISRWPLLTHDREIHLAKALEIARMRFRLRLLQCDILAQRALETLERVSASLRGHSKTAKNKRLDGFVANMWISKNPNEGHTKEQVMEHLPDTIDRVRSLLSENREDVECLLAAGGDERTRSRLLDRRRRIAALLEDTPLRPHVLQRILRGVQPQVHATNAPHDKPNQDLHASWRTTGEPPDALAATMREITERGMMATGIKQELVHSNLRLVVSIAKQYSREGPQDLFDRILHGNDGLSHGIDKHEYRRGWKFSTYATRWIRQAIGKGIEESGHLIRLSRDERELCVRMLRAETSLLHEQRRNPTDQELAERMGVSAEDVIKLRNARNMRSLDRERAFGDQGGTFSLLDNLYGRPRAEDPARIAFRTRVRAELFDACNRLVGERNAQIVRQYFDLDGGPGSTFQECGDPFGITKQRAEQIVRRALGKLRVSKFAPLLETFLEELSAP